MGPTLVIVMATGQLGKATITEIKEKYQEEIGDIKATTRTPEKYSCDEPDSKYVRYVKASVGGDKEDIKKALEGADIVFIIVPDTEDPLKDLVDFAQAAKESGVKHVLLQSASFADVNPEKCVCKISKMYHQLEIKIKDLFADVCILRLPLFMENNYAFIKSVKGNNTIATADDPTKYSPYMAVEDGGKAAAAILSDPEKHKGKTYTLINDRITTSDFVRHLGEACGREITAEKIAYEEWEKKLVANGVPAWQADNYVKLTQMIDNAEPCMAQPINKDFSLLTATDPVTVKQWCIKNAHIFKG